ncbi:thiol reductant ABC exporter subunit CydD [Actinoalloteichus hymeniacidonis]|uniref:thiol reductant ABC exporter subunit CydD n=1 Tax=Actinoalloteichus hymeniacidonis TaxID=340345 RepID=UPI0018313AF5|nr:thiol reductant ABC exporter subunit CydD [Actinoalloteichus hymeniacidonis]MBB5907091.1 thiol reductant ABC exporter CydD subunit [Actinoalloteichus hymeniacidonis]
MPRPMFVSWAVFAAVQGGLIIAQAELLARTIAGLETSWLGWLAAVIVVRACVARLFAGTTRRAGIAIRQDLGSRLLRHADSRRRGGEFGTLLGPGLAALDPYLTGYLPQLVISVIVPPLVLIRVGVADWISVLIILAALPLIPVFGILIGLRTREVTEHRWAELQRLGGHFRDVLAGLSTLRVFGRTGHQARVVREMATSHRRATMSALRVAFLSALVLELVCSLTVALVAVPIGLRLIAGDLALAPALVVLLLAPEALLPLRAMGTRFHAGAEGLAVAGRVRDILAEPSADGPAAAEAAAGGPDSAARQRVVVERIPPGRAVSGSEPLDVADRGRPVEITLVDVTVRYPGRDRPALDRVSLTVAPGERVAITGPSGAGKSTLLHVLLGFVAPDEGRVLIDGVEPGTDELAWARWSAAISWIPQQPRLFATTVLDNIRLGRPEADLSRVRAAASAADAAEFIDALPHGYATPIGERSSGVSAGQRQRIALARAFLRDTPVVLLDEPTARLDLHSESAVVDSAVGLLAGRTALVVAHRPAFVAMADRSVRLVEGRVVDGESPAAGPARPRVLA